MSLAAFKLWFAAVERLLVAALLLAVFGLAWYADKTNEKARAAKAEYAALAARVEAQNSAAAQTLKTLTAQRDAAQAALAAAAAQRERVDAENEKEIARLVGELEHRPVRVRLAPAPNAAACWGGSSSPASNAPAPAPVGTENPAPAYGLLPARNASRLGAVMEEMEQVNAAYASCRARLLGEGAGPANETTQTK